MAWHRAGEDMPTPLQSHSPNQIGVNAFGDWSGKDILLNRFYNPLTDGIRVFVGCVKSALEHMVRYASH